ncbi:hypothetical protein P7C70_g7586, partial [Phenoliferia sp. Uapishka_3]
MRSLHLFPLATLSIASNLLVLPSVSEAPACATYHGPISASHLFHLPPTCFHSQSSDLIYAPLDWDAGRLMWVHETALEESVEALLSRKAELDFESELQAQGIQQTYFGSRSIDENEPKLVMKLPAGQGHLVQFPSDASLSRWTSSPTNAFLELVFISPAPLILPTTESSLYPAPMPVPQPSIDRISQHLKNVKFNSLISILVSTFPRDGFIKDVKYLSGEDQKAKAGEGWVSRHSMSEGGRRASNWIVGEFRDAGLTCEQHEYANGFAPMVECVINGTDPDAGTFVLGGHFDSRGSFGHYTAPGADDDGSGTALLLSIARHIASHRLTFRRKVIIAAFSGEEQGLLGSNWFAKRLRDRGEDVVLMIQADMIGYRKPGEPRQIGDLRMHARRRNLILTPFFSVAFPPDTLGLQEARYLVGNLSTIYAPELVPGITPACCSDHQSFGSLGFASTWVFERNGPIADPFYHNSGDLSEREGYDFEQIYLTSTVVLATLLEVAGFSFI